MHAPDAQVRSALDQFARWADRAGGLACAWGGRSRLGHVAFLVQVQVSGPLSEEAKAILEIFIVNSQKVIHLGGATHGGN